MLQTLCPRCHHAWVSYRAYYFFNFGSPILSESQRESPGLNYFINRLFKMKLIDLSIYGTSNFLVTRTFGYEQLVREFASIFGLKSEISLIERTSQRTFMKLIFSLMKNGWPESLRIRTVLSWYEMIPSKQHSHRFSNISEVLKTVPKNLS